MQTSPIDNEGFSLEQLDFVARAKDEEDYLKRMDMIEKANAPKPRGELPIVSARDIMRRRPDRSFIVERFLLPKTVNMMYSKPGGYKTILMLDLCLCITAGEPWLGMKTHKGRVLILDQENSDTSIRDRLVGLVTGHNWKRKRHTKNLELLLRQGDLWDPKFVEQVHDFVKEKRVQLVVFDTIRRFGDFEENSSDSINQLYRAFQKIINGSKCSILFLHHANKQSGSYRGSVDLLGQVDTAYQVHRRGTSPEFKIECDKSRSGEIEELEGQVLWEEDKIEVKRVQPSIETEDDGYSSFKKHRVIALREIAELCPIVSSKFKKSELWRQMDALNVDLAKENRYNLRTLERVLIHLRKSKYLVKTDTKGVYLRIFTSEGGVFVPQGAKDA